MDTEQIVDIKFTRSHALSEEIRAEVTSILMGLIATYIDANGHIKEAHWNSEGSSPTFISIHRLYDEVMDIILEYIDVLGERIRAFGGFARANLKYAMTNSLLNISDDKDPLINHDINANLINVVMILKTISQLLYNSINYLDSIDKTTSNILQDESREIDKYIYLIQSNLYSS